MAAPVAQPKKEKKKKPVEQDTSVFLTGMVDDEEIEDEDDEDVQINSVHNDKWKKSQISLKERTKGVIYHFKLKEIYKMTKIDDKKLFFHVNNNYIKSNLHYRILMLN